MRTRDEVFPMFGGAGTKPTEAQLQEFGEGLGAKPDEVEIPSLALRRPDAGFEAVAGEPRTRRGRARRQ